MNSDSNKNSSEFQAAFSAGAQKIHLFEVETDAGTIPVLASSSGSGGVNTHSFEKIINDHRDGPLRVKEVIVAHSVGSFLDYFNQHKNAHSVIFIDQLKDKAVGIIDYHHQDGTAKWTEHRVTYEFPQSDEWSAWIGNSGKRMDQEEFAYFIEQNETEIVEPDSSEMKQIATTLKASINVDFRSSTRLENGQVQMTYHETINGTAGVAGQLEIPEKIKLRLRPFKNGTPYEVDARFRYRINNGKLNMWYDLIKPALSFDDAINDIVASIEGEAGDTPVYLGRISD